MSRRAVGSRGENPDDRATGADSLRSLSDSSASLSRERRKESRARTKRAAFSASGMRSRANATGQRRLLLNPSASLPKERRKNVRPLRSRTDQGAKSARSRASLPRARRKRTRALRVLDNTSLTLWLSGRRPTIVGGTIGGCCSAIRSWHRVSAASRTLRAAAAQRS